MTRWFAKLNPAWLLIAFCGSRMCSIKRTGRWYIRFFPALQKEFGYSDAVVGLTGALFLWGIRTVFSASGFVFGDRYSKRVLVTASLGIGALYGAFGSFTPNGASLPRLPGTAWCLRVDVHARGYALMANAHGAATRSKAISIFGTSQLVGVAVGGSLSGYHRGEVPLARIVFCARA